MLSIVTSPKRRTARRAFLSIVGSACVLSAAVGWPTIAAAGPATLRVGGTGAALGGMRLLADAFEQSHPDVEIEVLPSLGSGGGIRALGAGAIDIALSSRPRKEKERERDDRQLVEVEYARTPFVFVTRPDVDIDSVTLSEAAEIYTSKQAKWPDGQSRRLVLRPKSETDTHILRGLSEEMDRAVKTAMSRPGMVVAANDQDNATALEAARGTFGAMALGQLLAEQRQLKPLALDGVSPSPETLAAGAYPMSKRFYVIADTKRSPLAADLIAFMRSPRASEILEASGHLPTIGR